MSGSHRWLKAIATGLVTSAILIVLNWKCLEPSEFGERAKLATYDYIQSRLKHGGADDDLPVVIDTTDLKLVPKAEGQLITPRAALAELIDLIATGQRGSYCAPVAAGKTPGPGKPARAAPDARPKAIGVDVNFSPEAKTGELQRDDPAFFDYCHCIDRTYGVPVVLGIQRTVGSRRELWLASPGDADLAASIDLPHGRNAWTAIKTGGNTCPTFAARLADRAGADLPDAPPLLAWALERKHWAKPDASGDIRVEEFPVNYGPLERIQQARIAYDKVSPETAKDKFRNKVVLIGVAQLAGADQFPVPDRRDQPFPGVLVHACAVYTLMNGPLYELKWGGRLTLDLLLGALVFVGVAALVSLRRRWGVPRSDEAPHRIATWVVIVLVFFAGVVFVNVTHIAWDDFLLVAIGLLFHRPVESLVHRVGAWIGSRRGAGAPAAH